MQRRPGLRNAEQPIKNCSQLLRAEMRAERRQNFLVRVHAHPGLEYLDLIDDPVGGRDHPYAH